MGLTWGALAPGKHGRALIVPQEQLAPAPEEADLQALAILPLLVHDDVDGTEEAI